MLLEGCLRATGRPSDRRDPSSLLAFFLELERDPARPGLPVLAKVSQAGLSLRCGAIVFPGIHCKAPLLSSVLSAIVCGSRWFQFPE